MHSVLVTGAGGGGGNNAIRSLRDGQLDLTILGSNCLPEVVAKSIADQTFLVPPGADQNYIHTLCSILEEHKVDLLIPNNDTEVGVLSENREELPCATFVPNKETVRICQDKNRFFDILRNLGVAVPPTVSVSSLETIEQDIKQLPPSDKYWVRPRKGSGSRGATWVQNAEQARMWITLWSELRGYAPSDFQIANFLPGRDFNLQSIWHEGRLVFVSLVERLSYFMGENRLSGMSSTPAIARTLQDENAIQNALSVIEAIDSKPNGSFNVDMKVSQDGQANVTEINIGRFPMITTLHDAEQNMNSPECYVRAGLNLPLPETVQGKAREGILLLRDLDTEPTIIHENDLQGFNADTLRNGPLTV